METEVDIKIFTIPGRTSEKRRENELCTVIECGVFVLVPDSLLLVEFALRSFELAVYS